MDKLAIDKTRVVEKCFQFSSEGAVVDTCLVDSTPISTSPTHLNETVCNEMLVF